MASNPNGERAGSSLALTNQARDFWCSIKYLKYQQWGACVWVGHAFVGDSLGSCDCYGDKVFLE